MHHSHSLAKSAVLASTIALACYVGCADTNNGGPNPGGGANGSGTGTSTATGTGTGTGTATGTGTGTSTGTGSVTGTGTGTGTGTAVVTPGSYAAPPPNTCSNVFSTQGCMKGQASSACGGICANSYGATAANVCAGGSTGIPVNYACPRDMLYSDEMNQAVIDDGFAGKFNYAIVGHDPDSTGIDSAVKGGNYASCCQCYQLVFDYPKENQAWVDPNNSGNPVSAITVPMPIVVQSANTATNGPDDFDIFMGAGGFGANNGCYVSGGSCPGGTCMYTGFPSSNGGGLNVAGNGLSSPNPCKTSTTQWVTEASLTSSACAAATVSACNQITSKNAQIQAETQRSCIESNGVKANDQGTIPGDYHLNWYVWAKRVECPPHLTEVTGCKLAPQGLPAPDPKVQTVAQAKAAGFAQKAGTGTQFNTTQMEDCCMPSCAWSNNVPNPTTGGYNSLYSCDSNGAPWTTAVTRTQ